MHDDVTDRMSEPRGACIPEGWVLVPKEPTVDMEVNGSLALYGFYDSRREGALRTYRAMIAAAPLPPITERAAAAETPSSVEGVNP